MSPRLIGRRPTGALRSTSPASPPASNTSAIISALMAVERVPITRLTTSRRSSQAAANSSDHPDQPPAARLRGAELSLAVAVRQHPRRSPRANRPRQRDDQPAPASAATRWKSRSSRTRPSAPSRSRAPTSEDTITIDGHEIRRQGRRERPGIREHDQLRLQSHGLRGGARQRNVVLSSARPATPATEFIEVSDPGGNAHRTGRHSPRKARTPNTASTASPASSASNTVTNAIAGVTLTSTA